MTSKILVYSAGGLVTAVAPVVIDCKGLWVGWTGLDDFDETIDVIPESDPTDKAPTAGLLSNQARYDPRDSVLFFLIYKKIYFLTMWYFLLIITDCASSNRLKAVRFLLQRVL